jgi:membrane protein DedA with SNARE-associated domain
MNSFWESLYSRFKDRRYGTFFLIVLTAFFGLLVLLAWAAQMAQDESARPVVLFATAMLGVFLVAWLGFGISRLLARRDDRADCSRLSSDELAKARSKLLKRQTGKGL